jgi:hypothetical protein
VTHPPRTGHVHVFCPCGKLVRSYTVPITALNAWSFKQETTIQQVGGQVVSRTQWVTVITDGTECCYRATHARVIHSTTRSEQRH